MRTRTRYSFGIFMTYTKRQLLNSLNARVKVSKSWFCLDRVHPVAVRALMGFISVAVAASICKNKKIQGGGGGRGRGWPRSHLEEHE
jgi:hypothetical protein